MDRFFPDRNNELTPSHHPDYQKANPVKPDAEFIVMFHSDHGYTETNGTLLTSIFNKHSAGKGNNKPKPTSRPIPYTNGFVIKGVNWPIINDLRAHPRVDSFGPNHKIKAL